MHPIQSPQNRFCVLTLDPETLPAIATTLIDVLFYSHRWVSSVLSLFVLTPLFPMFCPITFHPPFVSNYMPCSVCWVPGIL